MGLIIGSARIDEKGNASGGRAGDQNGREVCTQAFYVHSKGWKILRAKNVDHANKLAERMYAACHNNHIGYDQSERNMINNFGIDCKTDITCDCSSLVRQCVTEATGIDPGNFTTYNEAAILKKTGLFEEKVYNKDTILYDGDILVTRTKGHTAIVVSGNKRIWLNSTIGKSITDIAKEVIKGKWGNSTDRKKRLEKAGYKYADIQKEVNKLLS